MTLQNLMKELICVECGNDIWKDTYSIYINGYHDDIAQWCSRCGTLCMYENKFLDPELEWYTPAIPRLKESEKRKLNKDHGCSFCAHLAYCVCE